VISATHRNLREHVAQRLFREDLFYRINVLDLSLPPLREREGDLAVLIQFFLDGFPGSMGRVSACCPCFRPMPMPPSRPTVFRATYGSWRTPSNTRSCSLAAGRSRSITCRP
jgi:hypothetical protein